jgi:hypothetical protein
VVTRKNYVILSVHPIAASFARSHVERTLLKWRLTDLIDNAQLIASELVTNAVKVMHAAQESEDGDGDSVIAGVSETFWIGLYRTRRLVVLEVWDASRLPPKQAESDLDDEGGRGLQLVTLLTSSWGYRRPATGGKIIWAALDIPSPEDPGTAPGEGAGLPPDPAPPPPG